MRQSVPIGPQPSMRAASRTSRGIVSMKLFRIQTPTGTTKAASARISPGWVSISPARRKMTKIGMTRSASGSICVTRSRKPNAERPRQRKCDSA